MLKIREAIVVEGRYDKNTLSQVVDTPALASFGMRRPWPSCAGSGPSGG